MIQGIIPVIIAICVLIGCAPMPYEPPVGPPARTPSTYEPPAELSSTFTYFSAKYDIVLSEVERPAKAKERYGEQKIERIQEEGIFKYYFEDEMVKILWLSSPNEILFVLYNKTDHSIRVVWDEAVFVDTNGKSHRVVHSGMKYTDRDNPQPPTVVVRKSNVSDLVFPTDYIYWQDEGNEKLKRLWTSDLKYLTELYEESEKRKTQFGRYFDFSGGWKKLPLLPAYFVYFEGKEWLKDLISFDVQYGTIDEITAKANTYIGKSFQVLLPLQIEDVVNDYIFTFKVSKVEVILTIEEL